MTENTAETAGGSEASTRWVPPPWEPPLAGTEVEHLLGALDRQRATFRWKADGLDAAGLNTRIGASTLTLGGLLKHLAVVEDEKFTVWLSGAPSASRLDGPHPTVTTPTSGCSVRRPRTLPRSCTRYTTVPYSARTGSTAAALANGDSGPARYAFGSATWACHLSLRRLLFDLLEEYGRHTGHADLLREAVDGRVGEDPPTDWRPSTDQVDIDPRKTGTGRPAVAARRITSIYRYRGRRAQVHPPPPSRPRSVGAFITGAVRAGRQRQRTNQMCALEPTPPG